MFDLIPRVAYLLLLGIPVTAFAAVQLMGVPLALPLRHRVRAEWALGVVAGFTAGCPASGGRPCWCSCCRPGSPRPRWYGRRGWCS